MTLSIFYNKQNNIAIHVYLIAIPISTTTIYFATLCLHVTII